MLDVVLVQTPRHKTKNGTTRRSRLEPIKAMEEKIIIIIKIRLINIILSDDLKYSQCTDICRYVV